MDYFFDWDALDWELVQLGVERKVVHTAHLMFALYRMSAGLEFPRHDHPHEQMATVLSGRIEALIGEDRRELGPRGGYRVPANVPHTIRVLEDAVILDAFTPIREDFLTDRS